MEKLPYHEQISEIDDIQVDRIVAAEFNDVIRVNKVRPPQAKVPPDILQQQQSVIVAALTSRGMNAEALSPAYSPNAPRKLMMQKLKFDNKIIIRDTTDFLIDGNPIFLVFHPYAGIRIDAYKCAMMFRTRAWAKSEYCLFISAVKYLNGYIFDIQRYYPRNMIEDVAEALYEYKQYSEHVRTYYVDKFVLPEAVQNHDPIMPLASSLKYIAHETRYSKCYLPDDENQFMNFVGATTFHDAIQIYNNILCFCPTTVKMTCATCQCRSAIDLCLRCL